MLINGKALAQKHQQKLAPKTKKVNKTPHKVVSILVGQDPASLMYTQIKQKKAEELGINFEVINLPSDTSYQALTEMIESLNKDRSVNGIMVQLPLPKGFFDEVNTQEALLAKILPKKDIDGLNTKSKFLPAVVKAVLSILEEEKVAVKGKYVVIIGSSPTVGLPIAKQLKKLGAQIVVCDINTKNLREETLKADVLITATGEPGLIIGPMIKDGVVIIDVGICKVGDSVVGDVDRESVAPKASKLTPVPGGVGPMTVISLMENIVEAVTG